MTYNVLMGMLNPTHSPGNKYLSVQSQCVCQVLHLNIFLHLYTLLLFCLLIDSVAQ